MLSDVAASQIIPPDVNFLINLEFVQWFREVSSSKNTKKLWSIQNEMEIQWKNFGMYFNYFVFYQYHITQYQSIETLETFLPHSIHNELGTYNEDPKHSCFHVVLQAVYW